MNKIKNINRELMIIVCINIVIFSFSNLIFDIKYEQVDDFIIYNLYSGLDGTYNFHGIYIHPLLCMLLSTLFRIIPSINWHSIFLLIMQFICFTIIGYSLLRKNKNRISIILYSIFASIFYTTLLLLLQYTSVSALLILTAFYMLIQDVEQNKSAKYKAIYILLYTIGVMLRIQSLLIILPFFFLYAIYYFIKNKTQKKFIDVIKKYSILVLITIIIYISNIIIYQSNQLYKEYMEYNSMRTTLQDLSYTDYNENKELFDEIGWTKNDHYLFFTYNSGDENLFNKEKLQKIIDYKISKNEYYNLNLNIGQIVSTLINEMINTNTYITIVFITMFLISLMTNTRKRSNIYIFLTTIGIHILFIILNRSMLRVVIPAYIIGTVLLMHNINIKHIKENKNYHKIVIPVIIIAVIFSGTQYNFNYRLEDYSNYQEVINYTNEHKENVYLYTVPSLQFRYLAYSVYEMPPTSAFSNLRVMGGWDMYTGNYYDFKKRYNLEGNFLDVLKDNVYVIDGDVTWSGNYYTNYIDYIVLSIKEHYNIEVQCEKVKEFNNIYIYKITKKEL